MARNDGMKLLTRLIKTLKVKPEHQWKQYADLICDSGGIDGATAAGFTVQLPDGIREVEFEGGLTEEHFCYFARFLEEDLDKAEMAQAVLQNKYPQSFLDWDMAWRLLRRKYGHYEDEWLPQRVVEEGFAAIALEIDEALIEYRKDQKDHPKPRLTTWTFEKPRLDRDSGFLFWGEQKWRFRKQPDQPVWELLCALERRGFPHSITLDNLRAELRAEGKDELKPEQAAEARRVLNNKTRPFLEWHATNDGCLSWESS